MHEFVNKVKSGARGLRTPEAYQAPARARRVGQVRLRPPGPALLRGLHHPRRGRMYTFRWTNLCDVIGDQDPADDVVRSPMNQDPIVLLPQDQRDRVIADINEDLDAPYTIRNEQALDPASEFYMDRLFAYYDDDLQQVLDNHVETFGSSPTRTSAAGSRPSEPKDKKNQDEDL